MGWKQCATAFPGDFEGIQDRFTTLFMALGAPKTMALFSRTSKDFEQEIFLLTPDAAQHSNALRGEWTDVEDPTEHGWSLLVGNGDPFTMFGLKTPLDHRQSR